LAGQDARHRRAARSGQRNPTAKLRLAEARNFQADWKLETGDAQPERDESTSLAASLLSKKRSKYTPASRDTAALSLNDRNNLVFSGARLPGLPCPFPP
jgi:hypothetical protein